MNQGTGNGEDAGDSKLDKGEAHTVRPRRKNVDERDVQSEEGGRSKEEQVARDESPAAVSAREQVGAAEGDDDADPDGRARDFPPRKPPQRNEYHIERREERCFTGGRLEEPELLEDRRREKRRAAGDPAEELTFRQIDEMRVLRREKDTSVSPCPVEHEQGRNQDERAEKKTNPVEGKRRDAVARNLLRREGEPPYHGGHQ